MTEVKTAKPLVSLAALQGASAVVTTAMNAENRAGDAWKKATKSLYDCDLRYAMISGKDADKDTVAELKAFIVSIMPEKKRLLILTKGRDVVELSDQDKFLRKTYQQQVGTYISRISAYLGKLEGVTVARKPKAEAAANADVFVAPETREQMLVALSAINAKCNTLGLPAKAAAQVADAVQIALAVLRSHKPKDETAK
jgi:hypothetical protein